MAKKSLEEAGIVRAKVNRQVLTSERFVSLYTNDTQIQTTPWDVRLIFGQISNIPSPESQDMQITQTGEVRMSPQHAKTIAMILTAQIQAYEEAVGPIALPRD